MNNLETRYIIKALSEKYKVNKEDVENIIRVISEFIMITSRSEVNKLEGHYPTFRVPGLGIFYVPEGVKKHVKTKLEKKLKDEISRTE